MALLVSCAFVAVLVAQTATPVGGWGTDAAVRKARARSLDRLLRPAQKAKPRKDLAEKLLAFAKGEAAGTTVGARTERLAEAVSRTHSDLWVQESALDRRARSEVRGDPMRP